MKFFRSLFTTPEATLACDEAILDMCEDGFDDEILRVWEPASYFVVLGHANKIETEVNREACRREHIPVLRRYSGGGTVLQGPGCLNFSLFLRLPSSGPLAGIDGTNAFVLHRNKDALQPLVNQEVQIRGSSDLALGSLKFSGNAQRRRQRFLLFHGTFLLDFDLPLIGTFLPFPSKQPAYRMNRPHHEFLVNLNLPASEVEDRLRTVWSALEPLEEIPVGKIDELARSRYANPEWTLKF